MQVLTTNVRQTLKLDAAFRPVGVIDAVEALVLCLMDKAMAVENYDKQIRSARDVFNLPAVIVLKRMVKFAFDNMSCNRHNILWRDSYTCQYCNTRFEDTKLTLDHVIPKSKGGQFTWKNLVTACNRCNQKKGDKTPQQASMQLLKRPTKPKNSILNRTRVKDVSDLWKDYLWEYK